MFGGLPKTSTDKIRKFILRQQAESAQAFQQAMQSRRQWEKEEATL